MNVVLPSRSQRITTLTLDNITPWLIFQIINNNNNNNIVVLMPTSAITLAALERIKKTTSFTELQL
jgi:predicted permease